MSAKPLQGLRILVTRPAHQAARLCELIRAAGGEPIPLPVLVIEPPRDLAAARALIMRLDEFDLAVFVSANAVERGLDLIREHGPLPPHIKVAAVGERTAAALVQAGVPVHITAPPPFNSEALLTCPELGAVAGGRIVIFRGEGGRERLAETLRQRGAEVRYIEVYRRAVPQADLAGVVDRVGEIAVVVVTSRDGLHSLMELAAAAGRRGWLLSRRLAVISERVAQQAAALGFSEPALVAPQASDPALVAAIAAWRRGIQAAQ